MRHTVLYQDLLRSLQRASEEALIARHLAEDADGANSDLYSNMSRLFESLVSQFELIKRAYAEEDCNCEEPNETYPKGWTCEAHTMAAALKLSHQYEKGDEVFARQLWITAGRTEGGRLDAAKFVGRITKIEREPNGTTMFRVKLPYKPRGRTSSLFEFNWQGIEAHCGQEA